MDRVSIDAIAYAKTIDLDECESAQARLLLYVVAENTFNDSFVCTLDQTQLAYEAGRASVRTVRRHLESLEQAGVILRAERRHEATGARLPDAVRLVGYKRWYHANHRGPKHRGATARATGQIGRKGLAARPAAGGAGSNRPNWPLASGQQVSGAPGQQVAGIEEPVLTRTKTPPLPPEGGRAGAEVNCLIEEVRCANPTRGRVLGVLLGPLVRQRGFSAPDRAFALGALADAAAGTPNPVLEDALRRALVKRRVTVKPADVEDALAEAREADKLAKAHEAKREAAEQAAIKAAAEAAAKAERAAAQRAAEDAITAEIEARADGPEIVEAFVRSLASPMERTLFRGSSGRLAWLAPIVREQALPFLAARGVRAARSEGRAAA